ncbi:MAG: Gfo/Idh/MocA family oxidoreductase [Planctomycetota bacterium]|nr:Gfo/Idh/MocA family oxidoreductase [Planctomycetota bacterium]
MSHVSRRQFLEQSMLAAAAAAGAASLTPAFAAESEKQSSSPNEKLSICCVGVRGQGNQHINQYLQRKDVEIAIVCDVDKKVGHERCDQIEERQGRRPQYFQDMRKAFDDKSINIVDTATPNHWHALVAIWAMQAGKDVYVEKPVSHNVSEGRRMVQTARKLGKICQTGTQCRSMSASREAIDYVKSGSIGEVNLARGLCYKGRGSLGPRAEHAIPDSINYDLWSGPAPVKPSYRNAKYGPVHYDWHWFWDYGNGDLGNQGIHQMDIARWGLGVDSISNSVISYGGRFGYQDAGETANTQVIIHDYGPKTLVFEVRGLKTNQYKKAGVGVIFEGTDGYVVLDSYEHGLAFDKEGNQVKEFSGGSYGAHFANFLNAVRNRQHTDLNADILEGHLSSALCHTGNIAYRLGDEVGNDEVLERLQSLKTNENVADTLDRTIEHLKANKVAIGDQAKFRIGNVLQCDPKAEVFPGNNQANAMLTREYRAPFVVPTADQI